MGSFFSSNNNDCNNNNNNSNDSGKCKTETASDTEEEKVREDQRRIITIPVSRLVQDERNCIIRNVIQG